MLTNSAWKGWLIFMHFIVKSRGFGKFKHNFIHEHICVSARVFPDP